MRIAVIPARGGSKRIPRKNVRDFCGRPMIAWSIAALQDSGVVDRIVVSTDDDEVADVARAHGAEVPFRRPADLADDHTPTIPVIAHAIRTLREGGADPTAVCCLYATAPLVEPGDLRAAAEMLDRSDDVRYVFSCTRFGFPVQRALVRQDDGVAPMFPQFIGMRSQDLPEAIHDAGQFYWGRPDAFLEGRPIFAPHSRPLMLPRHRVQDIDTPDDWERAEWIFRAIRAR